MPAVESVGKALSFDETFVEILSVNWSQRDRLQFSVQRLLDDTFSPLQFTLGSSSHFSWLSQHIFYREQYCGFADRKPVVLYEALQQIRVRLAVIERAFYCNDDVRRILRLERYQAAFSFGVWQEYLPQAWSGDK